MKSILATELTNARYNIVMGYAGNQTEAEWQRMLKRIAELEAQTRVAVVFRMDKPPHSDVFALMPEMATDTEGHYCACFQHVGQHSSADYRGCMERSRPATPEEYADLLEEMTRRGYAVTVVQRATQTMHNRRRKAAKAG